MKEEPDETNTLEEGGGYALTADISERGDRIEIRGWYRSVFNEHEWMVDPEVGSTLDRASAAKLLPILQAFLATPEKT